MHSQSAGHEISSIVLPIVSQFGFNGDSMKLFVVDDSSVIRQRLKRMLAEEVEIQVIGDAGDALAASAAILEQKPDAVVLDIHLSDGSGIDVLQNVKKIKPAPAVIILTEYPYPEYRQLCLQAGADFFFIKSTEFDQVIPALKQLMQQAADRRRDESTSRGSPRVERFSAVEPFHHGL